MPGGHSQPYHLAQVANSSSVHYTLRGSAIARIVGKTAKECAEFQAEVKMWVFEEQVNGRNLTEIINTEHENIKYLPGFKLPENVVSLVHPTVSQHMKYRHCTVLPYTCKRVLAMQNERVVRAFS